ncbi:MAG: DUF3160 domain-containing protein [Spirochaetales bacterium]|nr:DUF3160 domain-containing protein [Spirochaetales bacterium]
MRYLLTFLIIMAAVLFFACSSEQEQGSSSLGSKVDDPETEKLEASLIGDVEIDSEKIEELLSQLSNVDFKLPQRSIKKPTYNMPASYLNDELAFKSLDYTAWQGKHIAVVGKDNVYLYEDIISKGSTDFSGLDSKRITEVPKGTIVPLEKKYTSTKSEYNDMYTFNSMDNYWFSTTYQGKKGMIFGAYLAGLDRWGEYTNTEDVVRTGYYYTKPEKEVAFYDHVGNRLLGQGIKNCLVQDKLAFEKVKQDEYYLSIDNPDDLIALYQKLSNDKTATIFVTTDILMHCLHLLFDRMLEYVEQEKFLPILASVVDDYLKELKTLKQNTSAAHKVMLKSIERMQYYFQVAEGLVKVGMLAKKLKAEAEPKPWEDEKKPNIDIDAINASYPEIVKKELGLIYGAKGFDFSPIFNYKEDYSQFKPRGHYTRSVELEAYFRAMMWFGRIHMYIDASNVPLPDVPPGSTAKTRFDRSKEHVPYILILTRISKQNNNLFKKWVTLFAPINYVVGEADDLSFYDMEAVLDKVDLENLGTWLQKESNIERFIKEAGPILRGAMIQGNADVVSGPGDTGEGPAPPVGFRLFGQRFTIDSFIHNQLSGARVSIRNMVKGLDIMAVFGNRAALALLKDDFENVSNFKEQYMEMRTLIQGFDEISWRKTFYNGYLKLVQEVVTFQKGRGFYFTQSDRWDKKALLTSHASWAELRHDTILYVKQSYGERAGGGMDEPVFDIDPIPEPVNYVEPNLGFFYWLQVLLLDSMDIMGESGFMDDNFRTKFSDFNNIINVLTEIVEKEVQDEPINREQNEFIRSVPAKLARIILPPTATFGGYGDVDTFKMALVADVHTDALEGRVLEVGTGIPYRIYVALNDGHGGKRIAIGYTYSYYEFHQPMSDRLNDDQWKEVVYTKTDTLDRYLPQWAKDIVCQ